MPKPVTPEAAATIAAETLAALIPFFPANNELAITKLAEAIFEMCPSVEAMDFVTRRAIALWRKWQSVPELRAILCSKYKPKDGLEAYSAIYLDGVPSETPRPAAALLPPAPEEATVKQIEARRKAAAAGLPDGASASADPEAEAIVVRIKKRTSQSEDVERRLLAYQGRRPKPSASKFDLKTAEQQLREILAEQARNRRAKEGESE